MWAVGSSPRRVGYKVWNQLPSDALGTLSCKHSNFKEGVRKVINEVKSICGGNHKKNAAKGTEVKSGKGGQIVVRKSGLRRCNKVEWRQNHGEMRVQKFVTIRISLLLLFSVQYA
jgi:hypothetical protein